MSRSTSPTGARTPSTRPFRHTLHTLRTLQTLTRLGLAALGWAVGVPAAAAPPDAPAPPPIVIERSDPAPADTGEPLTCQVARWRRALRTALTPVARAARGYERELRLPLPRFEPVCRSLARAVERFERRSLPEAPTPTLRRHTRTVRIHLRRTAVRCLAGRPTAARASYGATLAALEQLTRELARFAPAGCPPASVRHPTPPASLAPEAAGTKPAVPGEDREEQAP